jgi:type IX secretion system PorP/SprF family membrane protein
MKTLKKLGLFFLFATASWSAVAQINPLKSQFIDNTFLFNASQAGADSSGVVSGNFSSQWNRLPGSPQIYTVSASAPISERMGIGLLVFSDRAGLFRRTSAVGAYSYLIPFSGSTSVRFGLSLGYMSEDLSVSESITQNKTTDPSYVNFGESHKDILKAGFGLTFKLNQLEFQTSFYNLNREINNSLGTKSVDRPGITSSLKYSFGNKNEFSYDAIVGYRQINGLSDYIDAGMKITYLNKVDLSAFYHTNKSITAGVGYNHNQQFKLSCLYNTEQSQIRGLTGGTFEVALYIPFSLIRNY